MTGHRRAFGAFDLLKFIDRLRLAVLAAADSFRKQILNVRFAHNLKRPWSQRSRGKRVLSSARDPIEIADRMQDTPAVDERKPPLNRSRMGDGPYSIPAT